MAFSFQELHAAGPYYVLAMVLQWEPLIACGGHRDPSNFYVGCTRPINMRGPQNEGLALFQRSHWAITIDRGCNQEPWGIEFTGKLKFFPSAKVGYYLSTRWVYVYGSRRIRTAKANPVGRGPRRFSCAVWLNLRSSPKINQFCTIGLPLMARSPSAHRSQLHRLNHPLATNTSRVLNLGSNYPEGPADSPIASTHAVDKDPEWSVDAVAGLARGTSIGNHAIHRHGLAPLDELNVAEWEVREGERSRRSSEMHSRWTITRALGHFGVRQQPRDSDRGFLFSIG
ncbi:hypothetical protein An01g02470 [Aspergillus niger]|uniref:Uncharacterized protein n=2 Tax=Aspergillus niger TaxID=5061 RepID=A2Q7Z3_ASPNC|nr:hypothetical protein An01g02470 [Aspergillus niger]CAK43616.1 hypothetical protein An01g02470 [Aspergillus niger]